jgi:hypothetical protein
MGERKIDGTTGPTKKPGHASPKGRVSRLDHEGWQADRQGDYFVSLPLSIITELPLNCTGTEPADAATAFGVLAITR